MPVMPAPTTSTSTSGAGSERSTSRIVPTGRLLSRDVERKGSARSVPYAIEIPDRARKERYFDPDFYRMEAELLWPRVWQMACRLEEMPAVGDFVEYEILDQSIILLRTDDMGVRAFQNACRHRGVKVVEGRGTCESGFTCPFHGWCYGLDGKNTRVTQRRAFAEHNLAPDDINITPVRCELWGGCAWVNLDDDAPPLRQCIEPFATMMDAWKVESLRTEWWYACRLPVNWKLAQEAFVEQYHVVETHPQLRIAGRYAPRKGAAFDARAFVEADLHYLRTMSEGMAGMVHVNDVRIAEGLRDIELPADATLAMSTWQRAQRIDHDLAPRRGRRHSRPQRARRGRDERANGLLLPALLRAPDVQQRLLVPLPSARTGGDADGDLVAHTVPGGQRAGKPTPPEPWESDDPRWPPIPAQDFSNLPRQQKGLHAKGFEYMRLSERAEGHISNFERPSTASSPAFPTRSCSRRCGRST